MADSSTKWLYINLHTKTSSSTLLSCPTKIHAARKKAWDATLLEVEAKAEYYATFGDGKSIQNQTLSLITLVKTNGHGPVRFCQQWRINCAKIQMWCGREPTRCFITFKLQNSCGTDVTGASAQLPILIPIPIRSERLTRLILWWSLGHGCSHAP